MISLRQHDRVGRDRPTDPLSTLPSIEERAAIARSWAASRPKPKGVGRNVAHRAQPRLLRNQMDRAVSRVVDPVLDGIDLEGCDVAGIRAFAERMLRPN